MLAIPRSLRFLSLTLCCGLAAQTRSLRSKAGGPYYGDPPDPPAAVVVGGPSAEEGDTPEDDGEGDPTEEKGKDPDISYLDNDTGAFSSVVFQYKETVTAFQKRVVDMTSADLYPLRKNDSSRLQLCVQIRDRNILVEWIKKHADWDSPVPETDPDPNDGVPPPKVLTGDCNIEQNNAGIPKSLHIHLLDACVTPTDCAVEYNFVNDSLDLMLDRSAEALLRGDDTVTVKPSPLTMRAMYIQALTNDVHVSKILDELSLDFVKVQDEPLAEGMARLSNGSFVSFGDGLAALQMLLDAGFDNDYHADFTVHGYYVAVPEKVVDMDLEFCAEDFMNPQLHEGLQGTIDFLAMRAAPSVVRSLEMAEDSIATITCEGKGFTIGPFFDVCADGSVRFYTNPSSYSAWNKTLGADVYTENSFSVRRETIDNVMNGRVAERLELKELLYPHSSFAGDEDCWWTEEQADTIERVEDTLEEQSVLRRREEDDIVRKRTLEWEKRDRAYRGIDDEKFDDEDAEPDSAIGSTPGEDPVIEVEEDPDFLDGLDPAS